MDGSAEGELVVVEPSVALDEPLDSRHGAFGLPEVLPLVDIADHLPDIVRAMAELGKFPVHDEELGAARMLGVQRWVARKQDTSLLAD